MTANLYGLIESRFPADRERPCFVCKDAVVSYADFETGIGRIAALLRKKRIAPGDRVVVQAKKSVEMVMLYLAVAKIGAIFVPLNTAYTETEVQYFVGDAEPALTVRDPIALASEAALLEPDGTTQACAASDVASIIYTSGTTGRSKGAMLSHGALAENGLALNEAWEFSVDDVLLHALPIYHVHGLFVALHCILLSGGTTLWLEKFDEEAVLAALPHSTVMMGVPTFYTRLLGTSRFTRASAPKMRVFISGSAPLLEATFAEFEERTGQRILERYGMSESVIITTNPLRGARVAGSVGYPLRGVELRIGGSEPVGQIEIRSPSLFSGYWRLPEKTKEDFTADGFFKTGDIGRTDGDGRVWIVGREKDLIISGGLNVYPIEIEAVIDQLPGAGESAVIGVPHPDLGEAVVAVVTGNIDTVSATEKLRGQLAAFKIPKRILVIPELPRNAMGKVQKSALRSTYAKLFGV